MDQSIRYGLQCGLIASLVWAGLVVFAWLLARYVETDPETEKEGR